MEQQENRVVLRGPVAEEATLSHQVHGIAFYRFPLAVPRLSGREDRLNILCPHTAPEDPLPQAGAFVEVKRRGQPAGDHRPGPGTSPQRGGTL